MPTSPVISNIVTDAFYCARDYDRAIEQARKTLELDPHFSLGRSYLALAYIGKGRTAEAVQGDSLRADPRFDDLLRRLRLPLTKR